MNRDPQTKNKEAPTISALAQDKTYGERKFDFIQNTVINFWVNLTASAMFTYWVTHSRNELKIPFTNKPLKWGGLWGKEMGSPSQAQHTLAEGIRDLAPMRIFNDTPNAQGISPRMQYSQNAAGVLTLTTGGHFIVIPSIWLGAKIKSRVVEWLDRRHYGTEAMEDPSLKARHAAIALEERPTFLGAVVGRVGAVMASQLISYTVGNGTNLVRWAGHKLNIHSLSGFSGLNEIAGSFGEKLGSTIESTFPDKAAKLDQALEKRGWTENQKEYHGTSSYLGKYLAQDVLYTIVTSLSVMPIINAAKRYIPGLTYTPKATSGAEKELASKVDVPPNPITYEVNHLDEAPMAGLLPQAKVSHIIPESTLHSRPLQSLVPAGA